MDIRIVEELEHLFRAADVDGFFYARDLQTGDDVAYRADEPVVTASTFKVPLLVELFRQGDAGRIDLTEQVRVSIEDRAPGDTGVSAMLDPVMLSWRDLAMWMIVVSDNAATDVICGRVGLEEVNATMARLGLPGTRLEGDCRGIFATMAEDAGAPSFNQFPDRPDPALLARLRALNPRSTNRTTPREMTTLLELIWTDRAASPDACAHMRRILSHQVWPHRLASGFPEDDVSTAGKTGTLLVVRNEAGVVSYPDGKHYAVATYTRSHTMRSKNPGGDRVIGAAARAAVWYLRGAR